VSKKYVVMANRWRWITDANVLIRLAVACGLLLRVCHYALNHTIWYDESVLLNNILDKGYLRLLGPLDHEVAAPPLFLWLLRTLYLIVGDEPYAWRAVPFAFSVGTLLMTVPLARRVLSPSAAALAVCLVAASDSHVWLGCTVKPYSGDAFLATVLLFFHVTTERWTVTRRLLVLAAVTPPILCFSYPAAFVIGGLLLAWLPGAWRAGGRGRVAWVIAAAAAALTFAVLYFGPVKAQRVTKLVTEWEKKYPNFADPLSIPAWLIEHTFGVFQNSYNPAGVVFALVAPLGIWAFWRGGRKELVGAGLATFGLVLLAASIRSYPYGQNRLMLFIAPVVLLFGAKGMDVLMARSRWAVVLAVLMVLVNDGHAVLRLVDPWRRPDSQSVQRYVLAHRQPGDAVLSDEAGYQYFFRGELKPILAGADVPVGGRAWVVMDHYTNETRRTYIEWRLAPLGFELADERQFRDAAAYLYVRKQAGGGR
jgi:hypothetical protein